MSHVTVILSQIEAGDSAAAEQLLPVVYDELRKLAAARLAHEKPGQTLQATALVHEAYLRLVDGHGQKEWDNRGHFFAAAAEAMRRILVDRARQKQRPKQRPKRGGDRQRVDLELQCPASKETPERLVAIDEAVFRLESDHPEIARLVKMRCFAGVPLPRCSASPLPPPSAVGRSHAHSSTAN